MGVLVYGCMCGYSKKIDLTKEKTIIKIIQSSRCTEIDSTSVYNSDLEKLKLLKNKLDEVEFKKLNDCFRCSDGLDYRIRIIENGITYENTIALKYDNENNSLLGRKFKDLQDIINGL